MPNGFPEDWGWTHVRENRHATKNNGIGVLMILQYRYEQITKCKDTKKRGAIAAISMKKLIHFALCKKNRCKQPDSMRIIFNFAEKTG